MDQMAKSKRSSTITRLCGGAMKYHPKFRDRRVIKRIQQAYGFARGVLSTSESHGWSTRYIDQYFGQQQHSLGRWLRNQLLICVDTHYNKDAGITKQYRLNPAGASYVRAVLSGYSGTDLEHASESPASELDILAEANHRVFDQQCVEQWIYREFGNEISSGQFAYEDKSNRLWHPLQSVRRQYKKPILAKNGLKYHYDIQCAAPTLIHQHAQRQADPMDLYLFALRQYLADRSQIRQDLAQALEVDIKTAKVVINALFCGARIGLNPDFALSILLGNDPAKITYLKENQYINELREDIRICWQHITPSMSRRSITDKNGRTRMLPISSREKWMRYFELERVVLNSIVDYMKSNEMTYFLEHDGWACDSEIDLSELEGYVYERTGYCVRFEKEQVINELEKKSSQRELVE
jgi:hypothetical protein